MCYYVELVVLFITELRVRVVFSVNVSIFSRYVVPVIVFSYTFHIPKFFEFEMKEDTENGVEVSFLPE